MRTQAFVAVLVCTSWAHSASANPPLTEELRALTARVDASPSDVELRLIRADALRRAKRFEDALDDVRMIEALRPEEPRAALARAEILDGMGRAIDAAAALDAFLATGPAPGLAFRAHGLRARIAAGLDDHTTALAHYDAALAVRDDVELHLERGRLLEALRRVDDAIDSYATGVAATGSPVLRVRLVEQLIARARWDEARAHADELVSSARVATRWLLLRARVHEGSGDARRARADREAALRDAERLVAVRRSPMAILDRGRARLALGRVDEARHDLEEAARRAPRLKDAWILLRQAAEGGVR